MANQLLTPRVPIIDARTGFLSREWQLFFQSLVVQAASGGGGGTPTPAPSPSPLEVETPSFASAAEVEAGLFRVAQDLAQSPPTVVILDQVEEAPSQLVAVVAELTKAVDAMGLHVAVLQATLAELQKDLDAINQRSIF